jgi:hypothetical protein
MLFLSFTAGSARIKANARSGGWLVLSQSRLWSRSSGESMPTSRPCQAW